MKIEETHRTDSHIPEPLNPRQQEAVLYFDSPLLIIAGAGSGKTKVITNKIAYLVNAKGFSPKNILGVTFTNKAAGEMRSRIEALTGMAARSFNISTFHSLGLRILRESGAAFGFDGQWQVMDESDQKKVIEKIIKNNFSYFTSDMRDQIKRKIEFAKMELNYPNNKEYLYQIGFAADEVEIYSLYFKYQKENRLWDYEDLVSFPVKLLQTHEDLRSKYAQRFKYVVVDEFQDTNPNQYELLVLIAGSHKNITVVGDDDQAIYSWRGASIRFLFDFEDDFPGARVMKLEQNYRSTPQVLDFANNLILKNSRRRPKAMWTEADTGTPVFILDTRSKENEAREIADLIIRLQEDNAHLFPLAILYRINSQSLAFESEFTRRHIDFKILKGQRFFDRKEIKDSLALLKLAVNPDDDISFLRVVDFLPLGIGPKTLDSLNSISEKNHISLFRALKEHAPDKFGDRGVFPALYGLHLKRETKPGAIKLSETLKRLLEISAYPDYLEKKGEESRILNIKELTGFIESWETLNPEAPFTHLMDHISLESGEKEAKEKNNPTPVFLLTMHNAKGLEFPTVIAAGINSTYMPFFMRKGNFEIEEERRLFYVAATRAIKQLIISTGSEQRSLFLSEISYSLYARAYSVEDIISRLNPGSGDGGWGDRKKRLKGLLEQARDREVEERYIEHPVFGRGKIISAVDEVKFVVEFIDRGEKTIDTSIVPVTFL
jgi:DNA helicase-2/ATP-dependent DNA helicase PcrA